MPGHQDFRVETLESGRAMRHPWLTLATLLLGAATARAQDAPVAPDGPRGAAGAAPPAVPGWVHEWLPAWMHEPAFLLSTWQWLGLLGLLAGSVVVDRLAGLLARRLIGRAVAFIVRRRPTITDDERARLERGAGRPFGFMAGAAAARLLLPALALPAAAGAFLAGTTEVLLAVGGVWAAYRLVDVGALYLGTLAARTRSRLDDMLVPLVRRTGKLFVLAIGAVFVAQNRGLEVGSLLAGLGIGGLAFALAAKDTLANLFGSVTVLADQPFQIGDLVTVAGVEGVVERVGFRSTRIRTLQDTLVTLPNAKLIDSVVDNFGQRRHRRFTTTLGIAYDTPVWKIEAFCEGLRELVRRHPQARPDGWHVYLHDLGESALLVLCYVFFTVPDWAAELQARHDLLTRALRLAEQLGVAYAFPTRTVHVAGLPAVSSERPTAVQPAPGPDAPADVDGARALGRTLAAAAWPDAPRP
jgi:MscS family membrane protein